MVVLVAMIPATPTSVQTLSSSSIACSVRSGAIFTRIGFARDHRSSAPPASACKAVSSSRRCPESCRDRNPGVFGELTLTAK